MSIAFRKPREDDFFDGCMQSVLALHTEPRRKKEFLRVALILYIPACLSWTGWMTASIPDLTPTAQSILVPVGASEFRHQTVNANLAFGDDQEN